MGRRAQPQYMVSGTSEYGYRNVGRGTAVEVLRKARLLSQQGYMDVTIRASHGRALLPGELHQLETNTEEVDMAKGQQRGNREAKKPKKDKAKTIAAAPSRKIVSWRPDFGAEKKK
jgi:hypothetical protein